MYFLRNNCVYVEQEWTRPDNSRVVSKLKLVCFGFHARHDIFATIKDTRARDGFVYTICLKLQRGNYTQCADVAGSSLATS